MKTITGIKEFQKLSDSIRAEGKKIGFVPTMGYLHPGHISLVKKSTEQTDVTIVSIFVNPTQFAPNEDFNKYPRDIEKDKKLLEVNGTDYLFLPDAHDIYPGNSQTFVEVNEISKKYEGELRPTHFKGVTTIVSILLNIVKPHITFLGQKDAQQAAILKRMVKDLHFDTEVEICPIIREKDGLAMSSRNIYLSPEERKSAPALYNTLLYGAKFFEDMEMNPQIIIDNMRNQFSDYKNIQLDYISIVNADNFQEPLFIEQGNEYYILIAARLGKTRLIDNFLISLYP
ncbi:MAG: pantoate--beta-alanine ligase [Ignavibacteriaceae bacterium]